MLQEIAQQLRKIAAEHQGSRGTKQIVAEVLLVATKLETHIAEMTPMKQAFAALSLEIQHTLANENDPGRFAKVERLTQTCQKLKRDSAQNIDELVAQSHNPFDAEGICMPNPYPARYVRGNLGAVGGGGYRGAGAPYGMGGDPEGDPLLDGIREIAQAQRQPTPISRARELRELAQARKLLSEDGQDVGEIDQRIREIQQQLQPNVDAGRVEGTAP